MKYKVDTCVLIGVFYRALISSLVADGRQFYVDIDHSESRHRTAGCKASSQPETDAGAAHSHQSTGEPDSRTDAKRNDAAYDVVAEFGTLSVKHYGEILAAMDRRGADLGRLASRTIDVGDGETEPVECWSDFSKYKGIRRTQILDVLRKAAGRSLKALI